MHRWTVVMVVMALLLAGCLGDLDERSMEPGDEDEEHAAASGEESDVGLLDAENRTEDTGDKNSTSPPAEAREDEVWNDHYICLGPPGLGCPRNSYSFDVEYLYHAIDVVVTMETAGSTLSNGLYVELLAPTGKRVAFDALDYGVQQGGETVSLRVDDPSVLEQSGMWTLAVWTVDIATTVVTYEARVSFTPPADHTAPPGPPPQEITLNATFLLANFVSTDWDQVAEFLPEGFAPRSPPDIPIGGDCSGLADEAVAIVLVWVFEYESASVDGRPLPGGLLAVAYAPTEPPEEWDYRPYSGQLCNGQSGRVWIGAVATEPGMAEALSSWGINAGVGEVTMDHVDAGPYVATVASSHGGPLEFTTVVQTTMASLTNDHNSVVAHYAVRDGQVFPMFDHQARYRYAAGANLFTGELGDFGSLTGVPSVASRIWFGLGNILPAGDVGVWRYYLVDPPIGP